MDVEAIAKDLGAIPADVPGLWWLPMGPELTTGQLLDLYRQRHGLAVRAYLEGEG